MSISNYIARLIWGGLLLIPVAVFAIFSINRPRRLSLWFPGISAGILTLTYVLAEQRFSFVDQVTNTYWLLFCYALYCLLVASCLLIKAELLRAVMLLVTALPICVGYFLATIGLLVLMFMISDQVEEPQRIEQVSSGFICRVWKWGMVFTGPHFGYSVHLYKTWDALPLIQRLVASEFIDVGAKQPDMSCSDLLAQYSRQ